MRDGRFDRLPSQRLPLEIAQTRPSSPPGGYLSISGLRSFGLSWIELDREIHLCLAVTRRRLWTAALCGRDGVGWERVVEGFAADEVALNRSTDQLNLQVPSFSLQCRVIALERQPCWVLTEP
jgi:hypothetical protein